MFSVANNKQHFHTKEEINMAQMYKNTENGKVVELVEINEKAKQVTVMYPDGTYKPYLLGSFKKHWKLVENTDVEQTAEPEQKAPKQKAEKKPVEKKVEKKSAPKQKKAVEAVDTTPYREKLNALADKYGMEVKLYDKLPNIVVLKLNGKGKMEVRFSKKGAVANIKNNILVDDTPFRTINNYYLPIAIDVEYKQFNKELDKLVKIVAKADYSTKKEEKNGK